MATRLVTLNLSNPLAEELQEDRIIYKTLDNLVNRLQSPASAARQIDNIITTVAQHTPTGARSQLNGSSISSPDASSRSASPYSGASRSTSISSASTTPSPFSNPFSQSPSRCSLATSLSSARSVSQSPAPRRSSTTISSILSPPRRSSITFSHHLSSTPSRSSTTFFSSPSRRGSTLISTTSSTPSLPHLRRSSSPLATVASTERAPPSSTKLSPIPPSPSPLLTKTSNNIIATDLGESPTSTDISSSSSSPPPSSSTFAFSFPATSSSSLSQSMGRGSFADEAAEQEKDNHDRDERIDGGSDQDADPLPAWRLFLWDCVARGAAVLPPGHEGQDALARFVGELMMSRGGGMRGSVGTLSSGMGGDDLQRTSSADIGVGKGEGDSDGLVEVSPWDLGSGGEWVGLSDVLVEAVEDLRGGEDEEGEDGGRQEGMSREGQYVNLQAFLARLFSQGAVDTGRGSAAWSLVDGGCTEMEVRASAQWILYAGESLWESCEAQVELQDEEGPKWNRGVWNALKKVLESAGTVGQNTFSRECRDAAHASVEEMKRIER